MRWESSRWWKPQNHLCRGHDFRTKASCKHSPSVKRASEHLGNCLLGEDISECLPLSEIGFFQNLRKRTAIIIITSSIFCCFFTKRVLHTEQLQLWALIHPFPVSSYTGGDEGHHASLTEVFAPLVWCLHSPVTALSPKCPSDCQSEFSLSSTTGVVPLSPNSPWPPCLLLWPQGHLHPFVVSLELNAPSKRTGYAALP